MSDIILDFAEKTEEAKNWLKKTIFKERDWTDFDITNVNGVNYCKKSETIAFLFQCKYIWRLNGCPKSVDREIVVVYDLAVGKISSPL